MNSYYLTNFYQAFALGFDLKLIVTFTCPLALVGALSIAICLNVSIRTFTIYFLYTKLTRERVHKLTLALPKLLTKSTEKRLLTHLNQLNRTICEWDLSRQYFEESLATYIPVVLVTLAFFPSMLILSGKIFTNRITAIYLANLFFLVLPTVVLNERIKKEVSVPE